MDRPKLHAMTNGTGRSYGNHEVFIPVLAGGSFLDLASCREVVHADAVLFADVPQELGRVRPTSLSLVIPLVRGETTATLMEKAVALNPEFAPLQARLRSFPAIDLQQGLGMFRSLGLAAGAVAAQEQTLRQRIRTELLVPLRRRKNGGISHAEIGYFNSVPGGTGGPIARAYAELMSESVLQWMKATVTLTGVQVGAVTFPGLGSDERIFQNSAVTLIEQIAFTLDPHRPAREARVLVLTELPTTDVTGREIGVDRETRSQLALTLVGAWYSWAVQEQILRGRPNRNLAHPCGSLTLVHASWYTLLGPDKITAAAARYYAAEIAQLSRQELQTASATVEAVQVELSPLPTSRPPKTAEDFIEMAKQSRGHKPVLVDQEVCASSEMTGEVKVRVAGNDMPLDQFLSRAIDIASVEHLVNGYGRLRETTRLLERSLTDARIQETKLSRAVLLLRQALLRATEGLFQTRLYDRAEAALVGFGVKIKRFRRAYQHYHTAQQAYVSAESRLKALDAGLTRVHRTIDTLDGLHRRLIRTLETLAGTQSDLSCTFQPLSGVFGDLIRLINTRDSGQLRAFLATTARAVTIESLAKMVNAEPTADGIAGRLLAPPQYDGPYWGGEEPGRAPFLRFIVLPPVDDALREQIHTAAIQHGLTHSVVAADTLAGGASVLSLELFAVEDLSEIFTPAYLLGLREALSSERDLYPVTERARALALSLLGDLDQSQADGAQPGRENP